MNGATATEPTGTTVSVATGLDTARDLVRAALIPLSREQVDLAIPLLEQALALEPENGDAMALLGTARMAAGDITGGLELVEMAAIVAPASFIPRLKAGEACVRIGFLAAAEEHYLAALRVAVPGSRDADVTRTLLVDVRKRLKRAIDHHATVPSGSRLRGVGSRVRNVFGRGARSESV